MSNFTIASRRVAMLAAAVGVTAMALGAAPSAYAVTGRAGWQGAFTYSVPTGLQHGFFAYNCPSNLIARSGGFFPDPTLQSQGIDLGVNGPRVDLGASGYVVWGFEYNIPGGAPAGTTILFDVDCTKAPA
jgi:hypothetical protein